MHARLSVLVDVKLSKASLINTMITPLDKIFHSKNKKWKWLCESVGRAVASNTRGPQFESNHRQFLFILNICLLSNVYLPMQ